MWTEKAPLTSSLQVWSAERGVPWIRKGIDTLPLALLFVFLFSLLQSRQSPEGSHDGEVEAAKQVTKPERGKPLSDQRNDNVRACEEFTLLFSPLSSPNCLVPQILWWEGHRRVRN